MRREVGVGAALLLAGCAPAAPGASAPPGGSLAAAQQAAEVAAITRLPAGHGRDVVLSSCLICHSAGIIVQQHKDVAAWTRTLRQMVAWGAPLPPAEEAATATYLAEHFGPVDAGQ